MAREQQKNMVATIYGYFPYAPFDGNFNYASIDWRTDHDLESERLVSIPPSKPHITVNKYGELLDDEDGEE